MNNKRDLWLVSCSLLLGCHANNDSLDNYIDDVERQARKEMVPQQPIVPFEAFIYRNTDIRQPFELPEEAVVHIQPRVKKDCWQPTNRVTKQPLEKFSLNQLQFKGVMSNGSSRTALIQTPHGQVAHLKKGQRIGMNHGQLSEINRQYLLIKETLPDGLGCWSQRSVKLALK